MLLHEWSPIARREDDWRLCPSPCSCKSHITRITQVILEYRFPIYLIVNKIETKNAASITEYMSANSILLLSTILCYITNYRLIFSSPNYS